MRNDRRPQWRALLPVGPHGWLWRRPGFTAAEVRHLLAAEPPGERGQAVRRCVARPQDWLPPAPDIVRCPLRYHPHLTRIVFWYARGESLRAISLRLGGTETSWGVEQAFDEACRRLAACLNRWPHAYGL
jgi:hypothetical protein